MEIITDAYRQSASKCGRAAAVRLIERRWWAFALPLAAALAAAVYDWRFVIVAFALALVAYPFVLMMAYYSHALTPEGAKAILRRYMVISDRGIDVIYEPYDEGCHAPEPERYPLSDITGYEDRGDCIAVRLRDRELIIPVAALDNGRAASLVAWLQDIG